MCPTAQESLRKVHYCPVNLAFDSPYKRRGGATTCRFEASPCLLMRGVWAICLCCAAVMLRCPPLKRDASLCLRAHLSCASAGWETRPACPHSSCRQGCSWPWRIAWSLSCHSSDPYGWWRWILGLPRCSGHSALAVGWLTTTP